MARRGEYCASFGRMVRIDGIPCAGTGKNSTECCGGSCAGNPQYSPRRPFMHSMCTCHGLSFHRAAPPSRREERALHDPIATNSLPFTPCFFAYTLSAKSLDFRPGEAQGAGP